MTSQKAGGGMILLQTLLCELGTPFAALRKKLKTIIKKKQFTGEIGGNRLQYTFKNYML